MDYLEHRACLDRLKQKGRGFHNQRPHGNLQHRSPGGQGHGYMEACAYRTAIYLKK